LRLLKDNRSFPKTTDSFQRRSVLSKDASAPLKDTKDTSFLAKKRYAADQRCPVSLAKCVFGVFGVFPKLQRPNLLTKARKDGPYLFLMMESRHVYVCLTFAGAGWAALLCPDFREHWCDQGVMSRLLISLLFPFFDAGNRSRSIIEGIVSHG
jgi:hypothetical protein